jgi:3-oxoacyl-[acyl-carrier protein] reductase
MTVDTLRGRTALVTGGFRGIGAAISRALAESGAAVAINYRERRDEATKLVDDPLATTRLASAPLREVLAMHWREPQRSFETPLAVKTGVNVLNI